MKKILSTFILLCSINCFAQKDPTERAKPIVAEGKRLYRSEMASWYGTDLFLENIKDRSNIGGYFSYTDGQTAICIFFSKDSIAGVVGTISFDSTYNTKTANIDLSPRDFTDVERKYYAIRKMAINEINTDSMFKSYPKTTLNVVPIISDTETKVYVLTGTSENGVVIFGNDYLLTFNQNNQLVEKKPLHRNIIQINYGGKEEEGKEIEGAIHSHAPETGEFITATDICTLMLYEKFTKWKQHNVVSKNYLSIWNCQTDELVVLPMSTIRKIQKDVEKKNKKGSSSE